MKPYTVMIGMPGPNMSFGTCRGLIEASELHNVGIDNSGNGFDDMDILWANALNRAEAGEITHYAQLHADVSPQSGWLDILLAECDRLDADLVSAVVPLKDFRGITSTGISHPDDKWGGYRRVAIRELPSLPKTFNAVDLGYEGWPLLVNTGCFVADLRKSVFKTANDAGELAINLNFPRTTYRANGKWTYLRESEDWHFSRGLHKCEAKYYASHAAHVAHLNGGVPFPNYGAWGTQHHDEETRWQWEQGPYTHLDVDGWFDFADLYQDRVRAVNGNPAHFVEVGSWLGKSAAFMASQIKHSRKNIRFDCVDNWEGGSNTFDNAGDPSAPATREAVKSRGDIFRQWQRNLSTIGVEEFAKPVRGDSAQTAEFYQDHSLDFVFIDADHESSRVYADLAAWFPKVKPGGVIAGHDYDEEGPKAGADAFLKTKALNCREMGRCFVVEV